MMNREKYSRSPSIRRPALPAAPQRSNEKVFGTITGKTVDDHFRRKQFHTVNNQIDIFFHGIEGERILQVELP